MGSNPGGGIFTEVVGWVTSIIPLRKFRQPAVARRPSGVLLVLVIVRHKIHLNLINTLFYLSVVTDFVFCIYG